MTVHPVFYCGCGPCKWACDNGNHRDNCPHDKSSEMVSLRESLRASNAALKAENEALKEAARKDRIRIENQAATIHDAGVRLDVKTGQSIIDAAEQLRDELARWESWQPSDPGTKEAMAFAGIAFKSGMPGRDEINVLAHALRAAMVRLEEAEKNNAIDNACGDHAFELMKVRADALTASLASMTAKIESWKKEEAEWKNIEIDHAAFRIEVEKKFAEMTAQRDTALASLAELRKRMEQIRIVTNSQPKDTLYGFINRLASPPSPAPAAQPAPEEP